MAEEEPIAAGLGDAVDATEDLGVERVGDVADDDAEQRAPAAAEGASQEIRLVAEVIRRGEDPLARGFPDRYAGLAAVEDSGHGRDRNPGALGDITKGDRPARGLHPSFASRPLDTADYRSD